jgi:histone H3/H4
VRTRIHGSSNDTTQRIPSSLIEPIQKVVESFIDEVFGAAEVEVGIELKRKNKSD